MKPTVEEKIKHLKEGVGDNCLVCGVEFGGIYTDASHQIRCWQCGVTYQVDGCRYEEDWLKEKGLKAEDIAQRYSDCFDMLPIFRDYWNETGNKLPLGLYAGDPAYTQEEFEVFYRWLWENRDKYMSIYKTDIQWGRVEGVATGDAPIEVAKRQFKMLTGHDVTSEQMKELLNIQEPKEENDGK